MLTITSCGNIAGVLFRARDFSVVLVLIKGNAWIVIMRFGAGDAGRSGRTDGILGNNASLFEFGHDQGCLMGLGNC